MVKVKMIGSLALTVLMGLGAAGSMDVFAEARELNVPAAKSALQETCLLYTSRCV